MDPFPKGPNQKKFILVAIDYFSKCVEAELLAWIIEEAVLRFLWKYIVCRYRIPHKLVSNNGRQFQGWKLSEWCQELGIQQFFTLVAYPQRNGQAKVVNRELVRGLKIKIDHIWGSWVEGLPNILWSYHTTPREGMGMTSFHLVYGVEAVVHVEVKMEYARVGVYNKANTERHLLELDFLTK